MINPTPVQEASPGESRIEADRFLFVVCQHGSEAIVKKHWVQTGGQLKLAYSRPGLVTLKVADDSNPADLAARVAGDWVVRHVGTSIGNVTGEQTAPMIQQLWELAGDQWDAIHVFERDLHLPGSRGFEPGRSELAEAVAGLITESQAAKSLSIPVNQTCTVGSRVLNVMLVEPGRWLIGQHTASRPQSCWPGGVPPIKVPAEMISRAYLKMSEALAWSQLPIEAGDRIVEIGSSPGGACQRLLDMGLRVTGIDPAEMDSLLADHPRFEHWQSKSSGVRRKRFRPFRWLAADANVAPNYTLDAVQDIVLYPTTRLQGLLLTFKLSKSEIADQFDEYRQRIENWGFDRVEFRQLATNRSECCVVAQRKKRPPRVKA